MKINKFISLLLVTSLLFASCNDFLEVAPADVIAADDHYKVENDVHNAVIGIYSLLQEVGDQNLILNELLSDLVEPTSIADGDFRQINEFNADTDNEWTDPAKYYKLIINCNDFLYNIEKFKEAGTKMDEDQINAHITSAVHIRSWAFFNLAKLYGSVMYFTDPIQSISDLDNKGIFTTYSLNALLDVLLNDIKTLEDAGQISTINWPPILGNSDYLWNRITVNHYCLKAELLLWKGEYQAVTDVLLNSFAFTNTSTTKYKVSTKWKNSKWINIFKDDASKNSDELLTSVPYNKSKNQTNNLQLLFSNEGSNLYQLCPTAYSIGLFESQQVEEDEDPGDRYRGEGSSYLNGTGSPEVYKYTIGRQPFSRDCDIHLYRIAEFHLMMAEALNRLGEFEMALAIMNNGIGDYFGDDEFLPPFDNESYPFNPAMKTNIGIRGRVSLEAVDADYNLPVDATPEDSLNLMNKIEDFIVDEIALELAYEGKRWGALQRIALRRNQPGYLADRIGASITSGNGDAVRAKLMDQNNWYLPYDK